MRWFPAEGIVGLCLVLVGAGQLGAEEDPYALRPLTESNPDYVYHSSPSDWRDVSMYQLITDRFEDGNVENNDDNPHARDLNPGSSGGIHGGDFIGLENRLPYLKQLGVNALWISPIPENTDADYHGYAAQDWKRVDPHWGTAADLKSLIDEMHAQGVYVVMDIVINHMGEVAYSKDPAWASFRYPETYELEWRNPYRIPPAPFNKLEMYHAHGAIHDWFDPVQTRLGNFYSLNDLKTTLPEVRQGLIDVFCHFIAATDCDAFRIDTVKHVEDDFWPEFNQAIHDFAATLGKTNFLIFGEYLEYADQHQADSTHRGFTSMLNFPFQGISHELFVDDRSAHGLFRHWNAREDYHPQARDQLVNFLDNHDGVLRLGKRVGGNEDRIKISLDFLYTWPGIPCLYYGCEQGFNGGHDPDNREDMFDGKFEWGPSEGDNFNTDHTLFKHVAAWNQLRSDHPALRYGDTEILTAPEDRRKLAYLRSAEGETVVVLLAWGEGESQMSFSHPDWQAGDRWIPIVGEADPLTLSARDVDVTLSGFECRVYQVQSADGDTASE